MPQQHSRGGEDDGPPDETKTYHTEGEQEEKASENVVGPRDSFDHLNDVKSSLIDEGESVSQKGSSSQRNKRLSSGYGDHSKEDRHKKLHSVSDGSKLDHIARFTPYSSLAFIANAGYPNGSMVGGPGITPKCGVPNVFPSPLRLGEGQKMPVLHPGAYPPSLAQLMMYQQEHYSHSPGTPPPHVRGLEVDSKTGILRRSHSEISPYHPLSPSSLGTHPLEVYNMSWPGQPFYPLTSSALRSPYPSSLAVSPASMARLGPSPIGAGPIPVGSLPHFLMHPIGSSQQHDAQQQSNDRHQKEKEKKLAAQEAKNKQQHIKKPLNAFMLYMKEMRASVVKECTLKESAAINQILGRRWHALTREEQAKYYELARKERQLHMQLYPGWSARDNYAIHGKKKKKKRDKSHGDNPGEPSTPKKCRARFGVDQQDFWCKPCRRKKKCIRYISSDENDHGRNDDDMDDDDSSLSRRKSWLKHGGTQH
uniref:HMG protein Tcf/Lef n=1 Tax=Strongylocentrotus purpuratus TaxID=7668 RepID=Q9Y0B2_STRPU|nr:HMG protein Tcf/Lef [Strongylocentrotus purpuratus]AAD45010.1 HMG protein Tcf/Lef [Strongylocentrotus purpuratus]|eukprot:NP_999640.1 HMG protein Tcf/Lef [Strongylocentrotus purpuratus]